MRFWRGLVWGGLVGSVVGLVLSANKPSQKPIFSKEIKSSAKETLKASAGQMKRRIMSRLSD
jgi:hypothetical protein